jgi:hypothetical protein
VEEVRPGQSSYSIASVSDDQIQLWVSGDTITAEVAATLREVVRRRAVIADLNTQIAAREGEITAISRDQERVRENMKALRGSAEERQLVQRYVQQLDDQETQLATHRRELAALMAKRAEAQADLDRFVAGLSGPA